MGQVQHGAIQQVVVTQGGMDYGWCEWEKGQWKTDGRIAVGV